MEIVVNGEKQQTQAGTLAELCVALGFADARVATAVNGDFVPASERSATRLQDEDHIEIVAPRAGG